MTIKPGDPRLIVGGSILLVVSVLFNIYSAIRWFTPRPPSGGSKVVGVIDGDTLVLEDNKTRVRLRHVDAPELEYCGGEEAKKELEKLVLGKKVTVSELIPDQRGRGMAIVRVGDVVVNREMLAGGWAVYHSDSTSLTDEMKAVAAKAKSDGIGMFGKCQSKDTPDKPGCLIKGNIDSNNTDRRRYYTPDCAQYKFTVVEKNVGEGWFCTEKEAEKAGFTKAETCVR